MFEQSFLSEEIIVNISNLELLSIKDFLLLWIIHTGLISFTRVCSRDILINFYLDYFICYI